LSPSDDSDWDVCWHHRCETYLEDGSEFGSEA
jgi:hypothetical protein